MNARPNAEQVQLGGCLFTTMSIAWSHPGKGHDRVVAGDHFVGVADGATPLVPGGPDPGAFAAEVLSALWRTSTHASGRTAVAAAITELGGGGWGGSGVSCSLAFVGEEGEDLCFGRLGDCSVLVGGFDGRMHRLLDSRLRELDRAARNASDPPAVRRHHRGLMNSIEGYWIVADDVRAAEHLEELRLPAVEVAWFMLASDGVPANLDPSSSDDVAVVLARALGTRFTG